MRETIKRIFIAVILVCIAAAPAAEFSYAKTAARPDSPKVTSVMTVNNHITIKWKKAAKAAQYKVYKKRKGAYKLIGITKKRHYVDSNVLAGHKYSYKVQYITKKGLRSKSTKAVRVLDTPLVKKLSQGYMSWYRVSGAKGYSIYSKSGSSKKWKKIGATKNTSFRIKKYNRSKFYTVRAFNTGNGIRYYSGIDKTVTERYRKGHAGKAIVFEGDSIMRGSIYPLGTSRITISEKVDLLTGSRCTNRGAGSNTLTVPKEPEYRSLTRDSRKAGYFKKYKVIVIAIGTNDYSFGRKLGSTGSTDETTFYGAAKELFANIKKQAPAAKVVVVTPSYRGTWERLGSGFDSKNDRGYTLHDYSNALKSVAADNGAYVYDSEKYGIINAGNYKTTTTDNMHPSEYTHQQIGYSLTRFMIRNRII